MEHIEEAGIHSGDSACSLPPYTIAADMEEKIRAQASAIARELGVVGLMNMQAAVHDGKIYIIEVNPRASRTVPFVSKAIGQPLAKIAAKVMAGKTLAELGIKELRPKHISVKEAVFPFVKFDAVDTLLGPEMRSTGEVMGIDESFAYAFYKSQTAAGYHLPKTGIAFLSLRDNDKQAGVDIAKELVSLGFTLIATGGTADAIKAANIPVERINKVAEGRPHCVDAMQNGDVTFVVNTTEGAQAIIDSHSLRRAALLCQIPYFTTIRGARAATQAIAACRTGAAQVKPLQYYHQKRG